jgi:hypothetical protein
MHAMDFVFHYLSCGLKILKFSPLWKSQKAYFHSFVFFYLASAFKKCIPGFLLFCFKYIQFKRGSTIQWLVTKYQTPISGTDNLSAAIGMKKVLVDLKINECFHHVLRDNSGSQNQQKILFTSLRKKKKLFDERNFSVNFTSGYF